MEHYTISQHLTIHANISDYCVIELLIFYLQLFLKF